MARFCDIAAGTRAIKRVRLRLCNMPCELLPDIPELAEQRAADRAAWEATHKASQPGSAPPIAPDDSSVEVGLRVLSGEETSLVLQKALAFAKSKGSEKADDTDPMYNLGMSVFTCAIACVDPDSDPARPRLFFEAKDHPGSVDKAAEVILQSDHLGRDGIVYLAEQHEHWQDENNAQGLKMSANAMWEMIGTVAAEADGKSFLAMRPALRWSFARFMACVLATSLTGKSLFGLSSEATTPTSTKKTEPDEASS